MQNNISKLKDIRGQFLIAEKTSEFIEEGLARDPPYVQRQFRVKISKDTPADEIDLCKSEATGNAKREASLMKIRMNRWEEEISALRGEITEALSRPNISVGDRTNIKQQITRDDNLNLKTCKDVGTIMKDIFVADIRSGADQFLITYTEDKESGKENKNIGRSKNFPSGYHQRRFRRVDWRGRWNFW